MNTETIIENLGAYQRWRRGDESAEQPHPKWVGEVIDAAVESLRSLVASNATLRRERTEARSQLASEKETRNAIIAKGVEMERRLAGLCLALETTRGNILSIKGAVAPGVVAYDEWLRVVDEALKGGAK